MPVEDDAAAAAAAAVAAAGAAADDDDGDGDVIDAADEEDVCRDVGSVSAFFRVH